MTDHWQVIEAALTEYEEARSAHWDGHPDAMRDRDEARAAIAFVREMRQQPTVPEDVRETIRIVLTFARRDDEAAAYINPRVDKALAWLGRAGAE